MPRHNRYNLNYFPLDVNFFEDHKILMIEDDKGFQGSYIALRLMAMVYEQGYYLDWKENFELTAAKRIGNGVTKGYILEVLDSCLKYGLFDQNLFTKHAILTSTGIQKRWHMVMTAMRRKIKITSAFWLITSEDTAITSEVITDNLQKRPITSEVGTQKEMKGNERKEKRSNSKVKVSKKNKLSDKVGVVPASPAPRQKRDRVIKKFIAPTNQDARSYFTGLMGNPKNQNPWPIARCELEADQFMDHYRANGWVQGRGKKPIVNWKAAVRNWVRNEIKGAFSATKPSKSGTDMQKNGTNSWKNGIPAAAAQQLPKIERDINYLYDRFQEGDQSITNIEPEHYNYLKTKGLISFPQSATDRIKETAVHFIQEEQLQASEQTVLKYMKIFGMQRFFQDLLKSGEARVFAPEGNRIVKTNQVQTHDYGQ